MNLIRSALRKPITILVLVTGMFFFGVRAVQTIKIDIFPKLDLPVIYLAHPFGGYSPQQMEAFFAKQYINIFLYVNGIKSIETKNIQGLTLMKISFYPGTNMAQAAAELNSFSTRIQAAFPPGSNPPFLIRFDASTLPVGQLVLSSDKRSNNELLDLANVYVRSSFTSIPGVVSSPPFGGNIRTVVINANPERLRNYNISPDQLVEALKLNNQTAPSGNVRIGDKYYITPTNTMIKNVKDFENIPLFKGTVSNLFLRDVATVEDGADMTAGYALVNGRRSVYLSIAKNADASTWEVVQNLKKSIPAMQANLPDDVKLSYEFDQSRYVINAVQSLMTEGIIGALLTGLMVVLFLGDPRGALIVILTIPTSIISAVLFLNLFGQTINIMTLSGLALAIGILVDESTVTIENIHQHMALGKSKALAIWDACKEIAFPKLLILFCILAVFAPAFTMGGIPGSLFLPLALAIGFSMVTSYFLSQTFVPIMANWIMKNQDAHASGRFDHFKKKYLEFLTFLLPHRKWVVSIYLLLACGGAFLLFKNIGRDVLPQVNGSQFQIRMRIPDGTRIEETERETIRLLNAIEKIVGKNSLNITSAYAGGHPQLFSVSPIYLFMAGSHEAVLQIALNEPHAEGIDELKNKIRKEAALLNPKMRLSFEPIELTEKILSQGSPTPIEVRLSSRNKATNEEFAKKLVADLKENPILKDVQIGQSIRYPALQIEIDRIKAAQLDLDMSEISRSLTAALSSSRYTEKNIWTDTQAGYSYSVQVQIPEHMMNSKQEMEAIPLKKGSARPNLGDVATITETYTYGEIDNLGAIPMLTVTANLDQTDLGTASKAVKEAIERLGELPRGLKVEQIGLTQTLSETLDSLQMSLLIAVVVICLMLAANFQSFKVSIIVLVTVPAVIFGALGLLMLCGSTLNLQSYMGIIMSVGVSISNAVLLITNAELLRRQNGNALASAVEASSLRIRPIIMTALAMVAGMLPMAWGHGEAGGQVSPLGRAVIGGLVASTFAALLILPLAFAWGQEKESTASVSLDPEDEESLVYVPS
jgi:multidrug efflux pump subunit AcrB